MPFLNSADINALYYIKSQNIQNNINKLYDFDFIKRKIYSVILKFASK